MKSLPKIQLGQVGVGSNIAHRKSLFAPIQNLTKNEIRSSWESVRTLLRITHLSIGCHIGSLFAPIHMPKFKFGSSYLPQFGLIYSYLDSIYHFAHIQP